MTCRGVPHLRRLAGPGGAGRGGRSAAARGRSAGGNGRAGLGWPLPAAPRPPRAPGVRPHPRPRRSRRSPGALSRPGAVPDPAAAIAGGQGRAGPAGGGRRRLGRAVGPTRLPLWRAPAELDPPSFPRPWRSLRHAEFGVSSGPGHSVLARTSHLLWGFLL